jgi:hypothetical protein
MSARMRWILAIVGLLLANVLAMVILAVTSSANPPEVIHTYFEEAK